MCVCVCGWEWAEEGVHGCVSQRARLVLKWGRWQGCLVPRWMLLMFKANVPPAGSQGDARRQPDRRRDPSLRQNVQFTSDASVFFQVQCQVLAFRVGFQPVFICFVFVFFLIKACYVLIRDYMIRMFMFCFDLCKNQEEILCFVTILIKEIIYFYH